MAAHRYWRIYITSSQNYSGAGLSEIQLRTSVGGTSVATGGTASTNSAYLGWPASNAFDGNNNTSWDSNAVLPCWVAYDLGVGNDADIVEIMLRSRHDTWPNAPRDFEIQFSDDGGSWTTLRSYSVTPFPNSTSMEFSAVETENYPDIRTSALEVQVAYVAPSDRRVSALEVQVAYVAPSDRRVSALETQVAYSKQEVTWAGIEVQVWVSTAQQSAMPNKHFNIHRYTLAPSSGGE